MRRRGDDELAVAVKTKFGALVATGICDANRRDVPVSIGTDQITRSDLTHGFVKLVTSLVLIPYWRPKVAAFDFAAVGLLLVDPPVAHL